MLILLSSLLLIVNASSHEIQQDDNNSVEEPKAIKSHLKLPLDRSDCIFKYSLAPLPLCTPYSRRDHEGNCMKIAALQIICPKNIIETQSNESQ